MSKKSVTVVFVADRLPVIAVLTMVKLDDTGRMRSNVSIRASSPQPVELMVQVQTIWQEWIHACVDGHSPALPEGWRTSDGGREAPTSRPPNHRH